MNARSLRVAIVAHNLGGAGGLSVGSNLLQALARVAPQHSYFVTVPPNCGYEDICANLPSCTVIPCDMGRTLLERWRFETRQVAALLRPHEPQVLLCLGNRGLPDPPCPQAVMVMDAHYFYPVRHFGRTPLKDRAVDWYNRRRIKRILRRTDMFVLQTPVAKDRFRRTYAYTGPIAVFPSAASALSVDGAGGGDLPRALAPYAERMKLFFLTRYYPHKNLESLVPLFCRFSDELSNVVVVVNVAPDGDRGARAFLRAVARKGLTDRVVNVGYIEQQDLAAYFRNCEALFLPTFLESFSGTYVEAMRYGLPILTSDLDFARGVCGDAALYFDPWDPRSIKDAIVRLRDEPGLAAEIAARGRARLQSRFKTWDVNVAALMKELEKLSA